MKRPDATIDRRKFLAGAGAVGAVAIWPGRAFAATPKSPNERLNIGMIGTAHRAAEDLKEVAHENIVALCDANDEYLDAAMLLHPKAARYNDFRKMLERNDLDAIVVATPDHTHAVAAMAALKSGRHVYCEKPLTHSVHETRALTEEAARTGLATQMGTQIHARDNYRRVVEAIRSGAIGPVTEAHVWVGKSWSGGERPTEAPPVPPGLHWDLWLGPAPERPYHPLYAPANWRRWWDFGGGTLADMGCHYIDVVFWALNLSHAKSAEGFAAGSAHPETTPPKFTARWEFDARPDGGIAMPALELSWYDDGVRPEALPEAAKEWESGVLFVGEKGQLLCDYDRFVLLPEAAFEGWEPPPQTIAASIGHHREWIEACKGGPRALCEFAYSGPLTETVLLGNVAWRAGAKIEWDAKNMRATNVEAANAFLRREYRAGWSL